MSRNFTIGELVEGKVIGIQPYGAFISLEHNRQGLVHISEITHGYVKDIHEFISIGDIVRVEILDIKDNGEKIALSIKATQTPPQKHHTENPLDGNGVDNGFHILKNKLSGWIEQARPTKK